MAQNVKVAISSDFLTAFASLPRDAQGKVMEFSNRFRNNPVSETIKYERVPDSIDDKMNYVSVDEEYSCIVAKQEQNGVYLLLWVAAYEKACAWAKNKRCEVNPKSGTLQVYDVHQGNNTAKQGIFAGYSDEELLNLGIPDSLLQFTKSLPTKEAFYVAKASYPLDAFEGLSWLAEGIPYEEVAELLDSDGTEEVTDNDISAALERPDSMKSFVVVEGEDELRNIMAAPLEKWRVFLHPTQRKLVKKNYSGPVRVLGGAGTGKTVVAMHRAKYLASKVGPKDKILFTTFTANLAADIKENLRKLCDVDLMRKIEVVNFDAWVNHYLTKKGYKAQVLYDIEKLKTLWERALVEGMENIGLPVEFYIDEWIRVVVPQEAFSLAAYVKASRVGRGTRLDRKKRIAVWKVIEAYMNIMKEEKVRDFNYATYECSALVANNESDGIYPHIIVDEAQDLSDNAYKLLRIIAGAEHANDLFIVGDAHQRIYKNRASLSRCGINVRGRSSILKINYRTTEEIRKGALAVLQNISFDDLDDATDVGDRCQSLTHGNMPQVQEFQTSEGELEFIVNEIKNLTMNGVALADICVVTRTNRLLDIYEQLIIDNGIKCRKISRKQADDRVLDGVRLATMHRVKGLEFQYVFVVAVNDKIVPLQSAIQVSDSIAKEESITSEKCLLYVAMTRAQKAVYITGYGKLSPFLK